MVPRELPSNSTRKDQFNVLFGLAKLSFSIKPGPLLPTEIKTNRKQKALLLQYVHWGHRNRSPNIAGLHALHYDHIHDVIGLRYISGRKLQRIQGEKDGVVHHPVSSMYTTDADL